MKSKIAVLFLIVLLCLTSGCSNTSQIAEQPAPVSSSESNKAPYQSETAQATEKTEVEQPRSTEPKDDDRSTEATAGVLDSSIVLVAFIIGGFIFLQVRKKNKK